MPELPKIRFDSVFKEYTHEMCRCGHFGGHSPYKKDNGHMNGIQQGHGYCKHNNCECNQFTWVGFCNSEGVILD
mgnify:CR=1 FL=1